MAASPFHWSSHGVLVTGGDGFLGPWLVEALAARGARVHALVRRAAPADHPSLLRIAGCGARAVEGDVADLPLLSRLLEEWDIDTVLHLAAINVNVGTTVTPYEVFETNTRGAVTVLEACRRAGGLRVVLASSREAEDCFATGAVRKIHAYMASKAAAELAARAYADTYGMPIVSMRSDNLYGGGDYNWKRLVPATIRSVLAGQPPVIHGDGSELRDFVYVEDAAAAYIAAAERADRPGVAGGLFRITTGRPVSTLDMVRRILLAADAGGLKPVVMNDLVEKRIDSPYHPLREQTVLGWSPRISLEDGLDRTVAAYRNSVGLRPC